VGSNTVFFSKEENAKPPPASADTIDMDDESPFIQNARDFMLSVLDDLNIAHWELSVLFCSDSYMRELNAKYRNKNEPTDVLSFTDGTEFFADDSTKKIAAGDIAVSLDTLAKNCAEFGVTQDEELKRLLVHGILHLNGYDHDGVLTGSDGAGDSTMLQLQENILQKFENQHILINN
jgi:probable rRNA maturation factor